MTSNEENGSGVKELLELYKFIDVCARIVCWIAMLCSVPYIVFLSFYIIAELLFRSNGFVESILSFIPAALAGAALLLLFLSTIYPQKPDKLSGKFWLALILRHAFSWCVIVLSILYMSDAAKVLKVAGKWFGH